MAAFKEGDHAQGDEYHDTPGYGIAQGMLQLGHILKVHAIHTDYKGEGDEYG